MMSNDRRVQTWHHIYDLIISCNSSYICSRDSLGIGSWNYFYNLVIWVSSIGMISHPQKNSLKWRLITHNVGDAPTTNNQWEMIRFFFGPRVSTHQGLSPLLKYGWFGGTRVLLFLETSTYIFGWFGGFWGFTTPIFGLTPIFGSPMPKYTDAPGWLASWSDIHLINFKHHG